MRSLAKEAKSKMKVNSTRSKLKSNLGKLAKSREYYITKAKEAKNKGDKVSYSMARSGLSQTVTQQKKTQEMLLSLSINMQLRDTGAMTYDFLDGMNTILKDISRLNKKMNFNKVRAQLRQAMSGMEGMKINLDDFLMNAESSFSELSSSVADVSESEIDRLIAGESRADEGEMASQLDELLNLNSAEQDSEQHR